MPFCGVVTDTATGPGTGPMLSLLSSCVTCPERLDYTKLGVRCTEFRITDDYKRQIAGSCEKLDSEHVGAHQIFPILHHPNFRTPTVKHHCPKTSVASSLRACSNNVEPDPKVFVSFAEYFRSIFMPELMKLYEQSDRHMSFEEWIVAYRLQYQQEVRNGMKPESTSNLTGDRAEAFSKIELQITEVINQLKETNANKVKERQICGASKAAKFVNACFDVIAKVLLKLMKDASGFKNFIDTAKTFDDFETMFGLLSWTEADGSGFDMSQLREHNELMNELFEACAKSFRTTWDDVLDKEILMKVLRDRLILKVSMERGNVKYTTEGRASGDGWTTLGNTILMIAYYRYTLYRAQVKDWAMQVKGDDVVLGVLSKDTKAVDVAHKEFFAYSKDPSQHGGGQISEPLVWKRIEDCSFLSNHFFRTKDGKLRVVRIPHRVIQTLSWSTKLPKGSKGSKREDIRQQLLYSKGMCLKAWAHDLPIWGKLSKKMIELGKFGPHSEYCQYADAPRVWKSNSDDYDAYLTYLEERFGLTKLSVQSIEAKIESITTLSGVIEIPELEMFYV